MEAFHRLDNKEKGQAFAAAVNTTNAEVHRLPYEFTL